MQLFGVSNFEGIDAVSARWSISIRTGDLGVALGFDAARRSKLRLGIPPLVFLEPFGQTGRELAWRRMPQRPARIGRRLGCPGCEDFTRRTRVAQGHSVCASTGTT